MLTSEIRAALPTDEPFLRQMLYLALFVPPGAARLPRSILRDRAISKYVDHWGTQIGDSGLLVIINGKQAGAAWLRCFPASDPGYGFVDSKTPELSVALLPGYRRMGIGMQLVGQLIAGTPSVSLSCHPDNPARRLYLQLGFELLPDGMRMLKNE